MPRNSISNGGASITIDNNGNITALLPAERVFSITIPPSTPTAKKVFIVNSGGGIAAYTDDYNNFSAPNVTFPSLSSDAIYPDATTATVISDLVVGPNTNGAELSSGTGAPSKPTGNNPNAGDIYFRQDTPTTANQRIYICTVGGATPTWVGIA